MRCGIAQAVDRARSAHVQGSRRPAPRIPNVERRLSVRYVAELSQRLPGAEVELLARATDLRERALVMARAGDTAAARAGLVDAGRFVDRHILSCEGRLSAHSFHAAAAAFVEHVEGQHGIAYQGMIEALGHCRRLRLEFGHSVEVRRVHLARNLVRLIGCLDRHQEAWELDRELLDYIWVSGRPWPLEKGTALDAAQRETLRQDERVFLADQLLSEAINLAVDAQHDGVRLAMDDGEASLAPGTQIVERVGAVLRLCSKVLSEDTEAVLEELAAYFELGSGELPMTWRRAERLFREVAPSALSNGSAHFKDGVGQADR